MAMVLMDRRARYTASQRLKRVCLSKEDKDIANKRKRRRDTRAARSEELRHADNLARSQERATVPEEEYEAGNQARREDYAAQPEELRQVRNQAGPSDRHVCFSACERCHHSSHACALLPCHRITLVMIVIQLLRLINFVQIAMAIPSPCTLWRLPRSSHLCKPFSLYRILSTLLRFLVF